MDQVTASYAARGQRNVNSRVSPFSKITKVKRCGDAGMCWRVMAAQDCCSETEMALGYDNLVRVCVRCESCADLTDNHAVDKTIVKSEVGSAILAAARGGRSN